MSALPAGALDFPKTEVEICNKWKNEKTFLTQDQLSLDRKDKEFTFYDGPPFATGLPHYGHILAGTIKDTVTRYAAMTGHHVSRRAGWDCHGLPVEYEIDQMLNITHRNQVLEMGIDKYNATCRSIVTRYTSEWESTITRLGRWIDFENDYKTMDVKFMESVWWVFSELFRKELVYQGYKVMPYSTACTTPLSNFEAGLNYKQVKDPAVVVSFPIVNDPDPELANVSFIAWTTTPWTLPSNLALCVNPELIYVVFTDVKTTNKYIMAKTRLPQLFPIMNNKKKWKPENANEYYIIHNELKGTQLVGKRYKPLFEYFTNTEASVNYFQVVSDSYVTDDAGTGIVHQAPAFGEDDYRVCLSKGIIAKGSEIPCPVDADGNFTSIVTPVAGVHVKKADETLIQIIKGMNRLVQKDILDHSYPFCWRSDTPLIYKAVPSWFVKVEEIRDKIVANNKDGTYWVPNEVKEGRFHNWLADARDWAVSRNRFWGTPIPIWANDDLTEVICISSIEQLEQLTNTPRGSITDLHRESIDHLTIPSTKTEGTVLRRVEEVFDCWFESGSMPYAQSHYPFENKEAWEAGFPADFIAEGLDQTRGWFYTLMVLSTALFDKPAFKNNIVNGMVLASDGQKMSKRKKNYPDPIVVINKYGADALRMYLINSPVVRAESLKFREDGVLGVVKEVFLPLYNAFRFFLQNLERWQDEKHVTFVPNVEKVCSSTNATDVWIQAKTQELIQFVHIEMKAYRLYTVLPVLVQFGNQLTNWYVRLNRDRLKGSTVNDSNDTNDTDEATAVDDTEIGLQVLYDVLLNVTILMAPFTPFLTEFFYQHLRKLQLSYRDAEIASGGTTNPVMPGKSDSVHFLQLPEYDPSRMNHDAVEAMETLQDIVEQGRNAREKRNISLKFPVKHVAAIIRNPSVHVIEGITGPLKKYILSELNTWEFEAVSRDKEHDWVTLSLTPNFKSLGKRIGKKMKDVQTAVTALTHDEAVACLACGKLEVVGEVLDATTDLESKFEFSKSGAHWEASSKIDGSLVVAVDCTQDDMTRSSGMVRELINGIQQSRKNAGLEVRDVVEVFFEEEGDGGITGSGTSGIVEQAIGHNLTLLETKFKGSVPLPKRFAPSWSVPIRVDTIDVGGSAVTIMICRPALSPGPSLLSKSNNGNNDTKSNSVVVTEKALLVLSTLDPNDFVPGQEVQCTVEDPQGTNGNRIVTCNLKEGVDFFRTTISMVRTTKAINWFNE